MAYLKWELGQHDAYQLSVGVSCAVEILVTAETGSEGPFEMAYETVGVGGWDDLVVFSYNNGQLHSRHFQAKEQFTNFEYSSGEKILKRYFADAAKILITVDPYSDGRPPLPENRRFVLGFPHLSICLIRKGHDELTFNALSSLASKCQGSGDSHKSVAASRGSALSASEREWLAFVAAAVGDDWLVATTVLRQFETRPLGTAIQIREQAEALLRALFRQPQVVVSQLEKAIRQSTPESRLREQDFRSYLQGCEVLASPRRVTFCKYGEGYFIRPYDPEDAISLLWQSPNAGILSVEFECTPVPRENLALRTAILRLALHTNGVAMVNSSYWWAASRDGLQGALGCDGDSSYADKPFFSDLAPLQAPRVSTDAASVSEFHQRLTSAMDSWLWNRVNDLVTERISRDTTSLRTLLSGTWTTLAAQLQPHWQKILNNVLKAPCEQGGVRPELRAGPRIAQLIAQTLLIITALRALRYASDAPDSESVFGSVSDSIITALSLDKISDHPDNPGGHDLWIRAGDLLAGTGLLVLGSTESTEELELAAQESLLGAQNTVGLNTAVSPRVLMSFERRFRQGLGRSEAELRAYFDHQLKRASNATKRAFEATIQQITEEAKV